jgi:CHASE3 domain sensor protein
MVQNIKLEDQAVIEEALQRMRSDESTIPAEKVRKFMTKIGEEIQRTGGLSAEVLNDLLKQLHDGVL